MDTDTEVFTTEAVAILEALKYGRSTTYKHICIMTDSASVLRTIQHRKWPQQMNPIVVEIINTLIEIKRNGVHVKLCWIKGHCGIQPNDTVDQLAKESCEDGQIYKPILTIEDLVNISRRKILKHEWNRYWEETYLMKSTQYAYIHPVASDQISWYKNCTLSRHYRSTIARLKFGHGKYPAHLYKLNLIESPACPCGHEEADLNHIILSCNKHKDIINEFYQYLVNKSTPLPTNIVTLLSYNNRNICDKLIYTLQGMKIKI